MDTLDTKIIEQTLEVMGFDQLITSEKWLGFVVTAYKECVPMNFYLQPASSSGKYHQGYELGVGGLVRHTKAAMLVAKTLFPLYDFTGNEENMILAALALHDIAKPSKTHPLEVKALLEPMRDWYDREIKGVVELIETHHGQWDLFGKMPRPKSTKQRFVHLCDYIASRKNIAVDIHYEGDKT